MPYKALWAADLTGGGTGAADKIPTAILADKNAVLVPRLSDLQMYMYAIDDDLGGSESSPSLITPDDESGNKRLIQIGITLPNTGLHLLDTNASNYINLKWNENDTGDRILNLLVHGADRTLDLYENLKVVDGQNIELHASGGEKAQLAIDTQNAERTLDMNENLTIANGYNVTLQALGQANYLILNESLTIGDGNDGTITFSAASKTLTVENNAVVSQDYSTDGSVTFKNLALTIADGGNAVGLAITQGDVTNNPNALNITNTGTGTGIYVNQSSAAAGNIGWLDFTSTVTSGDITGLRPRVTANAASVGANARGTYSEVILPASKKAALAQGIMAHVNVAAGSAEITTTQVLMAQLSIGDGFTGTNVDIGYLRAQTRGNETIGGNYSILTLENEAVGGNGLQIDSAIRVLATNVSTPYAFDYGIDLSGASGEIATADIRFSDSTTIAASGGVLTLSGSIVLPADGVIGVADGNPQIVFDNANNWLEITGSVGIGTATAEATLHVSRSISGTEAIIESVGNFGCYVGLRADQGNLASWAISVLETDVFRIVDDNASAIRMLIDDNGRIGIGTESPLAGLEISKNIYPLLILDRSGSGAGSSTIQIVSQSGDSSLIIGVANLEFRAPTGGDIVLSPNATEAMRIDSNGNVGIGATTFGADMAGGIAIKLGTDPTGEVADQFAFWGKDFAAGNTCPYFRSENGTVIGLNQSLLTTDNIIHNRLALTGGFKANLVTKTGAYTTTADDYTILCDASGGSFTLTLIALASHLEGIYHIKKTDSSANTVTLDGNGGETIDGALTAVLTTQYESITIQAGSEWGIL